MAVAGVRITVGTSATLLSSVTPSDPILYNQKGQSLLIQNPSTTVTVYLGGSNVTSTTYGFALAPQQAISIDLDGGENLYAAVATSTLIINVLRKGV